MNLVDPSSAPNRRSYLGQMFRHIASTPSWCKAALGVGLLPSVLLTSPAIAAEQLYVSYGPLERSISISSLETYAREGIIARDLVAYAQYASPEQLEQLQEVLLARAELSPVAVSQFLYTEQGETLLRQLGEVIQTESRLSGFYAIRAALILAAADPEEGLTPLNVLKQFPIRSVRIDINEALQIASQLEQLVSLSAQAIDAVEQQANIEAQAEPSLNFIELPDLQEPGDFAWQKELLLLTDERRDRNFLTDVYLPIPETGQASPFPAPVIVVSHGLGSDRTSYAYLGQHLASYGFVVAILEHPGSNAEQLQALVSGRATEVTEPQEFINRPLDVKFLLDELERLNQTPSPYAGKLDMDQVGVAGQSFGGYTALTLAGASLNLTQLAADCLPENSLNLSLLLQCRALELEQPIPDLQDDRVKAVLAINPVGSSLLSQEGFSAIDIPIMLVAANADTVAPALLEQIRPFTWLSTPNKYLLLMQGGATHFSTIAPTAENSEVVALPDEVVGPSPALARQYINAMSTAFFKTHVASQEEYRVYLGPSYVNYLSQEPIPLSMARFLTPAQLAQIFQDLPPEYMAVKP